MTSFYHGTPVDSAIAIARDGAILSPWEQEIRDLKALKKNRPDLYRNIMTKYDTTDEETAALKLAKIGFGERETEHRVKCVSLTSDISWLFYVPYYETILGIELERPPHGSLLVPRKVPLDALAEVHFKTREQEIRTAFAKYKPKFIKF